eukprot:PhM_4_TR13698/c1_g1_i3/m.22933
MSLGSSELDRAVDLCVHHITASAMHYFEVVRRAQTRGILWMVFTIMPSGADPVVKRVSFLPADTVANTQAPSLVKMVNACDMDRQFVAWFTVEGVDGSPLTSKVMLVEAQPSVLTHELHTHKKDVAETSKAASSLQRELQTFQSQRSEVGNMIHQRLREIDGTLKQPFSSYDHHRDGGGQGQPQELTVSTDALPTSDNNNNNNNNGIGVAIPPHHVPQPEAYQKILQVAMDAADATVRMGRAIDDMVCRVENVERLCADQTDAVSKALRRVQSVEKQQDEILSQLKRLAEQHGEHHARQRELEANVKASTSTMSASTQQLQDAQRQLSAAMLQQQQQQQLQYRSENNNNNS